MQLGSELVVDFLIVFAGQRVSREFVFAGGVPGISMHAILVR